MLKRSLEFNMNLKFMHYLFKVGIFIPSVYGHSAPSCTQTHNTTCIGFPRYYHFNHIHLPLPSSSNESNFFQSRDRQYIIQPGVDKICPELPIPEYTADFPMATSYPGGRLVIQHPSRGHASQPSSPVWIYMYPQPDMYPRVKQLDPMQFLQVGNYSFNNCIGLDKEISWANCTGTIRVPKQINSGVYTFWWRWDLNAIPYSDCFEVNVTSKRNIHRLKKYYSSV